MARTIKIQDAFDQALARIQNGEDVSAVLSEYPAALQSELAPLLSLSQSVLNMPVKHAPEGLKRKLFLDHQPARFFRLRAFVTNFNMAPLMVASLVLLVTGTVYASTVARPDEALFGLKRAYENVRVALTTNPENRASLQVSIAAARLTDAQKAFTGNSDSASQQAALAELDTQTEVALNSLKNAASNSSTDSSKSQSLVNQVEQITQTKNTLLAKVDPTKAAAAQAQNEVALNDIKNLIATSNDQSAASITTPQTISQTGLITALTDTTITVGQNEYAVLPNTEIQELNNFSLSNLGQLSLKDEVTVTGRIVNNKNIADTIVRKKKAAVSASAGASTSTTSDDTSTDDNSSAPPQNAAPLQKPEDTYGGFILESPVPITAAPPVTAQTTTSAQ